MREIDWDKVTCNLGDYDVVYYKDLKVLVKELMGVLREHKHDMYGKMYFKESDPLCDCEERKVLEKYGYLWSRGAGDWSQRAPRMQSCHHTDITHCPACRRRLP